MEKKCTACGGEIYYDGEDEVRLGEELYVEIIGNAWCDECGKNYKYEITHLMEKNHTALS